MELTNSQIALLRALAGEYAEIAALAEQKTRRRLWEKHNALCPERPMFLADQLPWGELSADAALVCRMEDPYWRGVEAWLRREIYKWKRLRTDMVADPYVKVPLPFHNSGWGLDAKVTRLRLENTSDVASQAMENLIHSEEDIQKIRTPVLRVDAREIERARQTADAAFSGVINWRFTGVVMHLGAWDTVAYWMGVTNCYIELMDRPEMMHALMETLTQGYLEQIEQINRLRLYDTASNYCHCSHTYANEPEPDCTSQSGWAFGLAQLFTSVSPEITREFECAYMRRIFPRFRHIYYGCCERLDDRLEQVCALPNVRKVSCSPWSDREAFAEKLPASIIMSNKPNPALLAADAFDEDAARADIRKTVRAARAHGKALELILKDVSTVRHDPARLRRFTEIAMEEVCG